MDKNSVGHLANGKNVLEYPHSKKLKPPPPLDDLEKIPNAVRKAKRVFSKLARGGGGARKNAKFFENLYVRSG